MQANYSEDEDSKRGTQAQQAMGAAPQVSQKQLQMEQKYSFEKFESLVNMLKTKLEFEQREWQSTVELLRQSSEFVIFSEKYSKEEYLAFMQESDLFWVFSEIMVAATDVAVYSQLLQTMGILVQNIKSQRAKDYLYGHPLLNEIIRFYHSVDNMIDKQGQLKIKELASLEPSKTEAKDLLAQQTQKAKQIENIERETQH